MNDFISQHLSDYIPSIKSTSSISVTYSVPEPTAKYVALANSPVLNFTKEEMFFKKN